MAVLWRRMHPYRNPSVRENIVILKSVRAMFLSQVLWPEPSFKKHVMKLFIEVNNILRKKKVPLFAMNSRVNCRDFPSMSSNRSRHLLLDYQTQTRYFFTFMQIGELPEQFDVLYCMKCFFGHCLIDHTAVFQRISIAIAVLYHIPSLNPRFAATTVRSVWHSNCGAFGF